MVLPNGEVAHNPLPLDPAPYPSRSTDTAFSTGTERQTPDMSWAIFFVGRWQEINYPFTRRRNCGQFRYKSSAFVAEVARLPTPNG